MQTEQNGCHLRFRDDGRVYIGGAATCTLKITKETILECLENRPQGENAQAFAERVVATIEKKALPASRIRIHSKGMEDVAQASILTQQWEVCHNQYE